MDFYKIKTRIKKKGIIEVYPDFLVRRSKDLMVQAKSFYAIWDEEAGLWSTNEYDVQRLVDNDLREFAEKLADKSDDRIEVAYLSDFSSNSWKEFRKYLAHISDNSHQLDTTLTFSDTVVKKTDYVSKRLPYPLQEGSYDAYDKLISVLYDEDNRQKLEWAIGAIISGESRSIQKFIVLYGEAGTGKSTVLNIIQKLFEGYYTTFEAKALTSNSNAFSTEAFKCNPLVAIQHDGDLSRIEDNTKLNSIVSHEEMTINEKYKPSYTSRINCFLFMGTNKPVRITDAKSGVIRRLIDVRPTGEKTPPKQYNQLYNQIGFELSAIAYHCLQVYKDLGKSFYNSYRPIDMMFKTNVFFNFVEDSYPVFKKENETTLKSAYLMYKQYCEESGADYVLPMYKFREELKNYFSDFKQYVRRDNVQVRSLYTGFLAWKVDNQLLIKNDKPLDSLILNETESVFDKEMADCLAQYARKSNGAPISRWSTVKTCLADIDTHELHYVQVPENHIVIDFDLKDTHDHKNLGLNLNAASKWPPTYAEVSKSGNGVHLHYIYDGDPNKLSRVYDEGIEIKVYTGNSSLRRKLTKCNNLPIAHINSGLPLKGDKVVNFEVVKNEKAIRTLIIKNLRKEIHPGTKPSVDFIYKILEDAYNAGVEYDVSDLYSDVSAFANGSTNHAQYCNKLVSNMHFTSEKATEPSQNGGYDDVSEDDIVFYDVEVFSNLFVLVWKVRGEDKQPVKLINPSSVDIEALIKFKLIGFNNRRYDNHILYARMLGYDNAQLYDLSQRIISGDRNAMFREAYNLSYTDIYDFASAGNKKSLKKLEIEMGIHHQELGLPWDEPAPEDMWDTVADYCVNDVIATEAAFEYLESDWDTRKILADITNSSYNESTNQLTTKLIFGNNRTPQDEFVYTDLSTIFPGYTFKNGHSLYMDEDPSEGGYVYAEPGIYTNVALLDIASMHPHSIIALNLFGDRYTKRFEELVQARIAVKHHDREKLKTIFDGDFSEYADASEDDLNTLATALKTPINSVYGLTSARFTNAFKDPRNIDNIVAKRGALFMITLKHEVQKRGYTVAHIKTDSIKIPNADNEIIEFVMDFGKKYGYTFEHEDTYERMCLVNDAVYIAKYKNPHKDKKIGKDIWWTATGAQFQHPYVFKTLFSKEKIEFPDLCEAKSVSTAMYLDMNEQLPEGNHDYVFIGKTGLFCPIVPGSGGGVLLRESKDKTKYAAVTGTKDYRWLEAETVKTLKIEDQIDKSYGNSLVDAAIDNISKYGDFDRFASDEPYVELPWD